MSPDKLKENSHWEISLQIHKFMSMPHETLFEQKMKYLLAVLFFIIIGDLFGQNEEYSTSSKKAIHYYQEADLCIRRRDFNNAIALLYRALEKDNDFLEAHNKLAFCYGVMANLEGQQKHLEEVIRLDKKNKYKNSFYLLGKVYYNQGRYKEAKGLIEKYLELPNGDPRVITEVEKFMININFALDNINNPVEFDPKPLPKEVNAFQLQYFPVLTADEATIFLTKRNGISFYDDEDIYYCEKDEHGKWGEPISISPNINSQFNEGTCAISADGQTLIFTSCDGRLSLGGCDLYISYKNGDEWSVPENLGSNINGRSWESQPSLSADGSKLYFVSDRAGGFGKRDIWVSEKDPEGKWMEAWNMGTEINTPEDEVSPFIHVNGVTFFFASKGFPGFGGYDIYKSEKITGGWSAPENLGYPINDYHDQVSLFVSTNGKNGYYSYEKRLQGMPNQSLIYTFRYPKSKRISTISNYLTGKIYEHGTNKPLYATVELIDRNTNDVVSVFESNKSNGEYFTILNEGGKYALYVESEGHLFESRSLDFNKKDLTEPIIEDFYLRPIREGEKTQLNNVYFDTDSDEIRPESYSEIDRVVHFLKQNADIRIEISGHTDNVGSEEYNMKLSVLRAKAVYSEIIAKGIEKSRITYRGYGMSMPVSSNDDNTSRQSNRRIEFEILK